MKSQKLYDCVLICHQEYGVEYCENCGLDENLITEALEEAYERGVRAGIAMKDL